MPNRSLTPIIGAAVCLAACSRPAPTARPGDPARLTRTREIELVEPSSGVSVVSELEAGRPGPAPIEAAVPDRPVTRAAARPATAALAAPALAPRLSLTARATPGLSGSIEAAPMARAVAASGPGRFAEAGDRDNRPDGSADGAGVLIRGGRGGPRDVCDRHRRRAVNRMFTGFGSEIEGSVGGPRLGTDNIIAGFHRGSGGH